MKKILFLLFLLTISCAAPVFAQEKTSVSESQCAMAVNEDFVGENITINVVNGELTGILNYITGQTGCDFFFFDDKIGKVSVTAKINNLPWNTALKMILKTYKLDMMIKEGTLVETGEKRKLILVATQENILREGAWWRNCFPKEKEPDENTLYTEFIKLENLPNCPNTAKCEQTSLALNHLKTTISLRLSEQGQIEIDESSQTLIITDVHANLEAIKNLVEIIDTEEFYKESEKVDNKKSL